MTSMNAKVIMNVTPMLIVRIRLVHMSVLVKLASLVMVNHALISMNATKVPITVMTMLHAPTLLDHSLAVVMMDTKVMVLLEIAMISMNVPLISKQKNTIVMRVFHVEILLVHLNVINVYLDGEVIMITVSRKMPNSNALQLDSLLSLLKEHSMK